IALGRGIRSGWRHWNRDRHGPVDLPALGGVGMRIDARLQTAITDLEREERLRTRTPSRPVTVASFVEREIVRELARFRNSFAGVQVVAVVHGAERLALHGVQR